MSMTMQIHAVPAETYQGYVDDPDSLVAWLDVVLEEAEDDDDVLYLEKDWDAVGRLIAGDAEGLLGIGEPIGDEDLGYGPPVGLGPEQVERLAARLAAIDAAEVDAWLASPAYTDDPPYPYLGGGFPVAEVREDVLRALAGLKALVAKSAGMGWVLLLD